MISMIGVSRMSYLTWREHETVLAYAEDERIVASAPLFLAIKSYQHNP